MFRFKKFFLASLLTVDLGVMSSGAEAQQTVTYMGGNTYAYFNGSTTTSYDLTTTIYDGSNATAITTNNPWSSSSRALADLFARSVGANFGAVNNNTYGPLFQYSVSAAREFIISNSQMITINSPPIEASTYAVATASVPEIGGALIPQVGLLLTGLFLIFGRRKDLNTEAMLAA